MANTPIWKFNGELYENDKRVVTELSDDYTSSAGAAASGIGASSLAVYNAYNTLNNRIASYNTNNICCSTVAKTCTIVIKGVTYEELEQEYERFYRWRFNTAILYSCLAPLDISGTQYTYVIEGLQSTNPGSLDSFPSSGTISFIGHGITTTSSRSNLDSYMEGIDIGDGLSCTSDGVLTIPITEYRYWNTEKTFFYNGSRVTITATS